MSELDSKRDYIVMSCSEYILWFKTGFFHSSKQDKCNISEDGWAVVIAIALFLFLFERPKPFQYCI